MGSSHRVGFESHGENRRGVRFGESDRRSGSANQIGEPLGGPKNRSAAEDDPVAGSKLGRRLKEGAGRHVEQ